MITKAQIKHISSLQHKKYRDDFKLFCVEGVKNVLELLKSSLKVESVYITATFLKENIGVDSTNFKVIEDFEMQKISSLSSPITILAIVKIPENCLPNFINKVTIVVDDLQDPGNLGTIIRIADWYGIEHILCSQNSVDMYNSKTIQATMGSFTRVNVQKVNLVNILTTHKNLGIYCSQLDGKPLSEFTKINQGFLVIGNEGKGVSAEIKSLATHAIYIPGKGKAESLNAAVACGIICSHLI